jgi:hypothetical protein
VDDDVRLATVEAFLTDVLAEEARQQRAMPSVPASFSEAIRVVGESWGIAPEVLARIATGGAPPRATG